MEKLQPSVTEFREQASTWLAANLEPRSSAPTSTLLRGVSSGEDESNAAARAFQRTLADAGFTGIAYPAEYGGRGLTLAHERAFNEQAQQYEMPGFGVAGRTTSICTQTMLKHASAEFLSRHIPKIVSGSEIWVQFFSEPEAGSDLASVRTRATRVEGGWKLNGSKIWTSGAAHADYGMCLARTDWDVPKHRGLTWFAVPISDPRVTVQPIREINGGAEFCQEFLDDVFVSDDDVIGEINGGWSIAQTMLVFERGGGSATKTVVSLTDEVAPDLVALARRAGVESDPITRQLIARAHINDFARNELGERMSARMAQSGGMNAGVAAYGKLAQGTLRPLRAQLEMRIGGVEALLWAAGDDSASRSATNLLDGRVSSIAGGTNEMQRNGIAERVLGLPREPSFDTNRPFNEVLRSSAWEGARLGE